MRYKQAIVVHNVFTNKNLAGYGKTLNKFIANYTARPDATQSLPGPGMASEWANQIDNFYLEDQFNSKLSFSQLAGDYLASEGVSFDNNSLSLSSQRLKQDAQDVQDAYLDGHSGMRLIISMDTDYLINQNIVDLPQFKQKSGGNQAQSFPGGGFDLVDETKLRYAVQHGMNNYVAHNGMQDPLWVAALQFDREHVHAHVACIDRAPLAESKRMIKYNGIYQDRGKVLSAGKELIRQGVDEGLTLSKGLHRSTVNNQAARSLVNLKSTNFDLQRRYQQRLASQLLRLVQLNGNRINEDANAEDLYQEKLKDYRESLVMQEAREFNLPANMTKPLNRQLDQVLDQQIQQLSQQGLPDQKYLEPPFGLIGSSLGKKIQNQADQQKQILTGVDRQVSSYQYLMHDYNRQFQQGRAGNGSLAMYSLYGYELDKSLRTMSVEQTKNPLGLIDNYQHRDDLVSRRRYLLGEREKLLEEGYQGGFLFNPDQDQLRDLLNDPQFQQEIVQSANLQVNRGQYWIADQAPKYQNFENVPAYQDLWMKANYPENNFGVDPNTLQVLQRTSIQPELYNELAGRSLHPQLRSALNLAGNNFDLLKQNPQLKTFVQHLRTYQDQVIDYTVDGVRRGLIRPQGDLFDSRELQIPAPLQRPLDCRNDFDTQQFGYLQDQSDWSGQAGTQMLGELQREQGFVKNADIYSQLSNQPSLVVDNIRWQQQQNLSKLNEQQPVLGEMFEQQLTDDEQEVSDMLHHRHHQNREAEHESSTDNGTVTHRQNAARQQERLANQQHIMETVRQQEMSEAEAEGVVDNSRKLVHRVLTQELNL